ncbi:putative ribonuclease H-like domain-containing protein [Tanacetum coccineum]|uniref:Ribonuclease H-like domain-containing protein n=1 Tax=Tanacetum coccineum TaxID=301880 RepID=A0ABQ5I9T3_9ASTR
MCDKKISVLFTDTGCFVLSPDIKLADKSQVLLKVPRKNNMYSVDMKNIIPKESLTCLVAKATLDESMLWHRRLGHVNFKTINKLVKDNLVKGLPIKCFENDQTCVACHKGKQYKASSSKDETSGILKSFITQIENLIDKKVKVIRCDNGTEFKNKVMSEFCEKKGIKREFSIARTPQQNGIAKRRNRTLIEVAITMLADSKLPTTFWAEAVNTACYVQNRVLVGKPYNKTPYELFRGRTPSLSFMKPFGCHITILNTLDHLGKFDVKFDDGFFVGYSLNSKAFRVYNIRTRKVEENLHVRFLEDKPIIAGTKESIGACHSSEETGSSQYYILMPLWKDGSLFDSSSKDASNDEPQPSNDAEKKDDEGGIDDQEMTKNSAQDINTAGPSINTASINFNTGSLNINTVSPTVPTAPLESTYVDFFGDESELDLSNIATTYPVPTTPNTRIHKDHSLDHMIVWTLVDLPYGKRVIGTKWVYINKKDERGIVIRNKVRLVAQGYTQEKGIDYDEMDVKSAFHYSKIEKEVYFGQALGFEDPEFPDKVYKVEKALYGLHQAPRAWYETLSTYLLDNGFKRGQIDKNLFIKRIKSDILLVQVYVDDIIFGSTKKELCNDFENQNKYVEEILKKFGFSTVKTASTPMETSKPLLKDAKAEDVDVHLYRSMIGSLMYLTASRPDIMFVVCACARFQVTPKVSHLHAVKRIFRYLKGQPKLGLWYPKDSPFNLEAYTDSDYAGASLDRKSTTGGCQFLGRRLISWQCKKQTIVANSTTKAEYVAAASCYGQVLWIQNQMLDYGYNFMNTKIFIDNESTICIVKNPVFHSKTKHIEIRHHFIRDSNEKKLIQMIKIHTGHNVADLLTKAFDVGRFQYLTATNDEIQTSEPIPNVPNEAVYEEWDDRVERAITTTASLDAGQASGNINRTQSMAIPNVPLPQGVGSSGSPRVHTLGSDEGSMTLLELTVLCTTLSKKVESLEADLKQTKKVYGAAYTKLIKKVKKLEKTVKSNQARRRAKIVVSDDKENLEDSSKQGRKIDEIDQDPNITTASAALTTAGASISTASPPRVSTAEDISTTETLVYIRRSAVKDKDIQATIEADEELAQRIQAEEREKYSEAEKARLLAELINQRKRYFAQQKAKERRNKPLIQAQ